MLATLVRQHYEFMTPARSFISPKFVVASLIFLFFVGMAFGTVAIENDDGVELLIEDDLLWLSTDDVSVDAAFRAFSDRTGFRLYLLGDLSETIAIDIDGVPLPRAVELLAGPRSTTITWRTDADGVRRMDEVWVFGEPAIATASFGPAPESAGEISLPSELTDPDPGTRGVAIEQLYGRPEDEAIEILREILATDAAPSVRSAAIKTLVIIGGVSSHEAISVAIKDSDSALRGEALQAMVQISPDESLTYMAQVLFSDSDPALRRQAAVLLARSDHPAARAVLKHAANYHDEGVREAVISAGDLSQSHQ